MSNLAQNQPGTLAKNPVSAIRQFIANPEVKRRLEEMLGKRSEAFANSIINVVKGSGKLQVCTPDSIMSSAFIAATMNLPIDPSLGFAAIVPYKTTAQFQLMYRGLIQLCIRSGQYARIHCTEVYKDEIKSYNPITGEIQFNDPSVYKMRYEGKPGVDNVAGFYAYFKLVSGFENERFMTTAEVMSHAKKFSKAYQYDLSQQKATSVWSTDPVSMGQKTVLKSMLSRYGIMSIEMQEALIADNADVTFEQSHESAESTIAAEAGSEPIDTAFESETQSQPSFLQD
jgi:recombination protein RecT